MRRRKIWLAYAAAITGVILVALLLFTVNRGPIARGLERYEGEMTWGDICFWCQDDQDVTTIDVLGIALIGVILLALPAGHIALLISLAAQMRRAPKFSDLEPAYECPHCHHPLIKQWRVCPYCGNGIQEHEGLHPPHDPKARGRS
jgi:hypothetical protein